MAKDDDLNPDGTKKAKPLYTVDDYFAVVDQLDEANDRLSDMDSELDYYKSKDAPPDDTKQPLYYVHAKDIDVDLEAQDFVQGLLGHGQLSVIYGESNCGKTFFMTDLCFHIATGDPWRDRRIDRGGVIYAALEGSAGLKKRVAAYRLHNKKNPDGFAMVPCHVDFMNPDGNITEFVRLLEAAGKELGGVKIVVIDTLARAISGGDENSGQDMGMLVKHADMIRAKTGAHVCFVHHSGKDKLKGARGHSSLRAAVDTEIEISREDGEDFSRVRVVKQREMELGGEMAFRLIPVTLGVNNYMEDVTSCVVEPCDLPAKVNKEAKNTLSAGQKFVYDAIIDAFEGAQQRIPEPGMPMMSVITYQDLFSMLDKKGYKTFLKLGDDVDSVTVAEKTKTTTYAARAALKKKGLVFSNSSFMWLPSSE